MLSLSQDLPSASIKIMLDVFFSLHLLRQWKITRPWPALLPPRFRVTFLAGNDLGNKRTLEKGKRRFRVGFSMCLLCFEIFFVLSRYSSRELVF